MATGGLTLSLNTSLTALGVTQQQLAVVSQNIANANTEGYSRKITNLQAQYLAGNGVGVNISSINRRVDDFLIANIRGQKSATGRTGLISDYMDRTQLLFGNPGSGNSINSYIGGFFNILQSLSQTPEDASLKAATVQNAVTMGGKISQLAQNLQDLRYQADQDLYSYVAIINNDIKQVDLLNTTISQNVALGRPVSELQDQRDQFLNDLSQYLDIQTYTRSNGTLNVSTGSVVLLDDSVYQLKYNPIGSTTTLVNNSALSPLQVFRSDSEGNPVGNPVTLATGVPSSEVSTIISSGKIRGILDMRDKQIPQMLAQLDVLAANMRDEFNAIHNAGSGFPGAYSYTGSHALAGPDFSQWSGKARIAVLGSDGQPISSGYANQPNGFPPLLLDLSTLDSGGGPGRPTTQAVIDEINQYFGIPQNKVKLGNLSNIQIASNNTSLPGSPALFSFDLDLQNLAPGGSKVFVTDVQVLDDTSADITSVSQNVPSISIDATNGFVTTNGSNTVTINTSSAHGLSAGDKIFLPNIDAAIGGAVLNGISTTELNDQYFTITNVTSTSFDISVSPTATATSGGSVASTGATLLPNYAQVAAGEQKRTTADGTIDVSLTGNSTSAFYTIRLDVGVVDQDGTVTTSTISYRVDNSDPNALNRRYPPRTATGQGTITPPSSTQAVMRAILADADGVELPKVNGKYVSTEEGYLKLIAGNSSYVIAIDSLDSEELGDPEADPPVEGTGRGFSHYFGLNNFFVGNDNDDDVTNSALNFAVEQRLINNPNLISTGTLTSVYTASGAIPTYSYQRTVGDQSVVLELASLANTSMLFAAAGGIGSITQTLGGYAGQMVSAAASAANAAKQNNDNANLLAEGFNQRSKAISGVNMDEELANTVILQNAYAASARIVTVVNGMFDALDRAFG
jgi:flagellar hook-associated protein FlgK